MLPEEQIIRVFAIIALVGALNCAAHIVNDLWKCWPCLGAGQ